MNSFLMISTWVLVCFFSSDWVKLEKQPVGNQDISGVYKGITTQNEGGLAGKYDSEFLIELDKNGVISGYSAFMNVGKKEVLVKFLFRGQINDDELRLYEYQIAQEQSVEGYKYCYKTMIFKILIENNSKNQSIKLVGDWTSQNCSASFGKINLERVNHR